MSAEPEVNVLFGGDLNLRDDEVRILCDVVLLVTLNLFLPLSGVSVRALALQRWLEADSCHIF